MDTQLVEFEAVPTSDFEGMCARLAQLEEENAHLSEEVLRLDNLVVEMNDEIDRLYSDLQDEREEVEGLSAELDTCQDVLREHGLMDELDEIELCDMAADLEDVPLEGE